MIKSAPIPAPVPLATLSPPGLNGNVSSAPRGNSPHRGTFNPDNALPVGARRQR